MTDNKYEGLFDKLEGALEELIEFFDHYSHRKDGDNWLKYKKALAALRDFRKAVPEDLQHAVDDPYIPCGFGQLEMKWEVSKAANLLAQANKVNDPTQT